MKGQCLCGAVKFSATPIKNEITACHCSICRKQSGGIPLSIEVDISTLLFEDESHISIFHSSDWAHRGFCKNCGTMIFWKMNDLSYCNMNHFLFDLEDKEILFTTEFYIEDKPLYYNFSNQTVKMTESELLEKAIN